MPQNQKSSDSYFIITPIAEWSFENFKKYKEKNSNGLPHRPAALRMEFLQQLLSLKRQKGQARAAMRRINELLEFGVPDEEEYKVNDQENATITYIITGQGASFVHNGNNNFGNTASI